MMKKPTDPKYAFFSANLFHYLDSVPWNSHPYYFETYCDIHAPKPIPHDFTLNLSSNPSLQPGLLVAFHLGDHLALPVGLSNCGVPFDVLIDKHTYSKYQLELRQASQLHAKSSGHTTEYFFSDDPRLAFRIRHSLRNGRHVLIFVDGNGGAQSSENPQDVKGLIPVSFFSGTLWVKKGVAILMRLLNAPMYVLFSPLSGLNGVFEVVGPITTNNHMDRDDDCQRLMSMLYGMLEQRISSQPMLWECWLYLHVNGMLRIEKPPKQVSNPPEMEAEFMEHLVWNGRSYWLDKRCYRMHALDLF